MNRTCAGVCEGGRQANILKNGVTLDIGQTPKTIFWLPSYDTMVISKIRCSIKSSPATFTNHLKCVPCQGLTPLPRFDI